MCGRKKQKSNKGGDAVKVHLHCIRDGLGWPIAPAVTTRKVQPQQEGATLGTSAVITKGSSGAHNAPPRGPLAPKGQKELPKTAKPRPTVFRSKPKEVGLLG